MSIEEKFNKYLNEGKYDPEIWDTKGMKRSQLKSNLPSEVYEFVDKVSGLVKAMPVSVLRERSDVHIHYNVEMGNFSADVFKKLLKLGFRNMGASTLGAGVILLHFENVV